MLRYSELAIDRLWLRPEMPCIWKPLTRAKFRLYKWRQQVGYAKRPLKNVQFCSSSRKAIILTTGIHRVFRGLKFEPDAEIGQKGAFCKGLAHCPENGRCLCQNLSRF